MSSADRDASADSASGLVLIVEDHPLVQLTAREMIEDAGLATLVAKDADEALAILTTRGDIRAVLSDVDMPGSMDGVALAAIVNDRWPAIRTVLTSGGPAPRQAALPKRVTFHAKPYDPQSVIDELRASNATSS